MNSAPQLPEFEDEEECYISTIEELASYLNEHREFAATLVRKIANDVAEVADYPILEILEKGYEDSFYIDDLLNLDTELDAIVLTPWIETSTDWHQPLVESDFWFSVIEQLQDIGVDEELASDFQEHLKVECVYLIEEKGKSKPNSSFVDIFGRVVYEQFKPLVAERLQRLDEWLREMREQYGEDEEFDDEQRRDTHRDAFRDAVREAVPIIAKWMAETIEAAGESLVFDALI